MADTEKDLNDSYSEKILFDGIPLPYATEVDTHVVSLTEKDLPPFDRRELDISGYVENDEVVVLTNRYVFQHPEFRFTGKPVYLRNLSNNKLEYKIPRLDTSYIKTQEEWEALRVYEKAENGERVQRFYKDKEGCPILDEDMSPIPVIKSKDVRVKMKISDCTRNLDLMRKYFDKYVLDPNLISNDGHSISKHLFDAPIALKMLIDPEYKSSSYFSVNQRQFVTDEQGRKVNRCCHVLSTKEAETLLGFALPEKVVHTQIATEIANEMRKKLDRGNGKEFKRVGGNFFNWLKEFSNGNEVLGFVLLNEVKYLLINDYNCEYGVESKYSSDDISTLLSKEKYLEIVGSNNRYFNEFEKIESIFGREKVNDGSYLEKLFPFERKVDDLLTYLKHRGVDEDTMSLLKLSAHFNECVRPVVVLKSQSNGRDVLPTNSIVTSYLEKYPRNFFVNGIRKCLLKSGEGSLENGENGRRCREMMEDLYVNGGSSYEGIHDVHLIEEKWVDSISKSLGKMLEIDGERVEEYAKDVFFINERRRRKN